MHISLLNKIAADSAKILLKNIDLKKVIKRPFIFRKDKVKIAQIELKTYDSLEKVASLGKLINDNIEDVFFFVDLPPIYGCMYTYFNFYKPEGILRVAFEDEKRSILGEIGAPKIIVSVGVFFDSSKIYENK